MTGPGQGGGEFSEASLPSEVGREWLADFWPHWHRLTEYEPANLHGDDERSGGETILTETGHYHGHCVNQLNSVLEKVEVELQLLREWVLPDLVAVPGEDDVVGDVPQGLDCRHQADTEDGETPGEGEGVQWSAVEEEVNSGQGEEEAAEVEGEREEMSVEFGVGDRERVEDWSGGFHPNHQYEGRHEHRDDGDVVWADSVRFVRQDQGKQGRAQRSQPWE